MKKIGGVVYVHYSAHRQLTKEQKALLRKARMMCLDALYDTEIYKIDLKNQRVSLIQCKDFDTAREPEVGKSWVVDVSKKTIKEIKPKGQIYHHKWMFVQDDYKGFDIEESKKWSETWRSIFPQDRKISSRIGYKKYWNEYLKQYNLVIE